MITAIDPHASYEVTSCFDLRHKSLSPDIEARTRKLTARLKKFGASPPSAGWTSFEGDASKIQAFTQLALQLAKDGIAIHREVAVSIAPRPLSQAADDQWVLMKDTVLADSHQHDGKGINALRVPPGIHWTNNGLGASEKAHRWIKANIQSGYTTTLLENTSTAKAPKWYALWPEQYIGPGLDHPWSNIRQTIRKSNLGLPQLPPPVGFPHVTIAVPPAPDSPAGPENRNHRTTAKPDSQLTDPTLIRLAQSTSQCTISLSSPRTYLVSQLPKNVDIAWSYGSDAGLALRAWAARALIAAKLAAPDAFVPIQTTEKLPQGCKKLTLKPQKPTPPTSPAKPPPAPRKPRIKNPALQHVHKALLQFISIYADPWDKNWSPVPHQYPAAHAGLLPRNWVDFAQLPGVDELIVSIATPPAYFEDEGKIQNPDILPPYHRLIEVAGEGNGDVFLLLTPPKNAGAGQPWLDCPVALHDHETYTISQIWPSVFHFALDWIHRQHTAHVAYRMEEK